MKKIVPLRLTAGMTQKELARQAHTSQAAISRPGIRHVQKRQSGLSAPCRSCFGSQATR